ncbi:MAG: hypothetical protein PHU40_06730 [Sulfurimonas sp.]|nr:hypothetical protein [Sulfurimonas sp.]
MSDDYEYNHRFENYVQQAHQESRNQEIVGAPKAIKTTPPDSMIENKSKESKMKIPRIKSYKEEPSDIQAMMDNVKHIKAINIHNILSDEIEGVLTFENDKLIYTALDGFKVVGLENILNYNPTFIIKPKYVTNEICKYFSLILETDKAQWMIYQIEANMKIEKRNPFLLSVKQ